MKTSKIVKNILKNGIHIITIIAIFIVILQLKKIKSDEKFAIQEVTSKEIQEVTIADNEVIIEKRKEPSTQITSRYSTTRSRKFEEIKPKEEQQEIVEAQYAKVEDITISRDMDLTITTGISK